MNLLRVGVLLFKEQQLWFGKSAIMYIILSLDKFTELLQLLPLSKKGETYFLLHRFLVLQIYSFICSFFLSW
jgi:hypothetical protein